MANEAIVHKNLMDSQVNEELKNGEVMVCNKAGFIVVPEGNKSISVDVKFTDAWLHIIPPQGERIDPLDLEEELSKSNASIDFKDNQRNCSLVRLIEEKRKVRYLEIPLGLIESVNTVEFGSFEKVLMIKTKDFRQVALKFMPPDEQSSFLESLKKFAFVGKVHDELFLVNYKYTPSLYFKKETESPAKLVAKNIIDDYDDEFHKMSPKLIEHLLKDSPLDEDGWKVYDFQEGNIFICFIYLLHILS